MKRNEPRKMKTNQRAGKRRNRATLQNKSSKQNENYINIHPISRKGEHSHSMIEKISDGRSALFHLCSSTKQNREYELYGQHTCS